MARQIRDGVGGGGERAHCAPVLDLSMYYEIHNLIQVRHIFRHRLFLVLHDRLIVQYTKFRSTIVMIMYRLPKNF